MESTLVFIAPVWDAELEELIQITKESFQIKVLTQRQNIDFSDPYIEILQCFETYSIIEIAKLVPWLIHLKTPQFHLLLPQKPTGKALAGIGSLISIVRALPHSYISYSPWNISINDWNFKLWLKAFSGIFNGRLPSVGQRKLILSKNSTDPISSKNYSKSLELYKQLWVCPSLKCDEFEIPLLIQSIAQSSHNYLEFWNWNELPIRQQNIYRKLYANFWKQIQFESKRKHLSAWSEVQFLILFKQDENTLSESDLLDLALNFNINIVMDSTMRQTLQGPWEDGDSFWLIDSNNILSGNRPWNNPLLKLPFTKRTELKNFRDYRLNQILRSFIKLDFPIQK